MQADREVHGQGVAVLTQVKGKAWKRKCDNDKKYAGCGLARTGQESDEEAVFISIVAESNQ